MGRQQLSALDVAFLCLEQETTPMHFGALLMFSAPPAADLRRLVTLLGERAGRLPPLRQRVRSTWFPLGGATWVEEPGFRIDDHLALHYLEHPGDREELIAVADELMARPLELTHPLWRLDVIGGLADGGFAVLAKLHHAVCDGPGAVELGLGLFDGFMVPEQPPAPCEGGFRARGLAAARSASDVLTHPARWIGGATKAADLVKQGYEAAGIFSAIVGGIRRPDPASPLRCAHWPRRRIELSRLSLSDLQRVRALHGGTINDVLLALVAGALREWLTSQDCDLAGRTVRALVPVNLRQGGESGFGRNQVSGYLCDLPVGEPDPVKRLHTIRSAMDRNKAAGPRRGTGAFPSLADQLPRAVHRIVTPAVGGLAPLLYDLVISNVPLPAVPLALGGAGLREVYPFVPLATGHAMGIAACSYGDVMCLGIYADSRTVPDLANFADSLERALDELDGCVETTERARSKLGSGEHREILT